MKSIIPKKQSGQISREERPWDPFELMRDMLRFDPFGEMGSALRGPMSTFTPSFEVKESKDAFVFRADVPGLKEEDLDVSLTGNRLTISGKREEEKRDEGDRYYAYECSYGSFSRTFTLPEGVDAEHVDADLNDGVLTLRIAKKPEVQPRRISVRSAERGQKELKA